MKSIVAGMNNESELSGFDDGFFIMVWHFLFWMEFPAIFVLAESRYLVKVKLNGNFNIDAFL